MKSKFPFFILLSLSLLPFLASCVKLDNTKISDDLKNTMSIELKTCIVDNANGLLHFQDHEEFLKHINAVKQFNEKDYLAWASRIEIPTHRYAYLTILKALHSSTSEEEFFQIIHNNPDIVYLAESDGEMSVERTINNTLYSSIVNLDGEYAIGDIIYKVFKDYIVWGPLSHREKLKTLLIETGNEEIPNEFSLLRYTKSIDLKTGCGLSKETIVIKNEPGCGDDRKLRFYINMTYWTYYDYGAGETAFVVDTEIESKSSYKLFCVWVGGPSTHYHKDIDITQISPCGSRHLAPADDSEADVTYFTRHVLQWSCYETQGSIYFSNVCGKASSNGVGADNYAIISCNCN